MGLHTVILIEMPYFQYIYYSSTNKSDFAHISDLYSLVIGLYKSEMRAKNNLKTNDVVYVQNLRTFE